MRVRLNLLAAALGSCLALAASHVIAGPSYDRIRVVSYVDDSMITAKVKARLLAEDEFKGFEIGVETDHGRVLLSGFVDSPALRERALRIASEVEGVLDVRNAIVVR